MQRIIIHFNLDNKYLMFHIQSIFIGKVQNSS